MMLRPKSLIEIKETFVFSSDVDSGAKNKSELGDYFQVQLNNPLNVPADALNCNLRVLQSSIWYTTPNISTVQNNNTIYYNDGVADKTIVLPNGLYGIDDINLVLARACSKRRRVRLVYAPCGQRNTESGDFI